MKKIIFAFLLMLFAADIYAGNAIKLLSNAPDIPFSPPVVKSVVLSNGMKVYAIEDHSLPIVQGKMFIKGGAIYDDVKKDGVTSIMAALLQNGGTKGRTPEEVRQFLHENAIDVSFASGDESVTGDVSMLAKDIPAALGIFFEMLFEPRFDKGEMETIKKVAIDGIKRSMQQPGPIAHNRFKELVYGKDNIWGHIVTPAGIKKLNGRDVSESYQKIDDPENMILAIAGDFKKAELIAELEKIMAKYPKKARPAFEVPAVAAEDAPEFKVISKKFTQSSINIGHLASTRDDPEKFALVMMNDILGGSSSFSNRLVDAVRVKNGLAYEVWSSYAFGPKGAPGLFKIHAKTGNKTTRKAEALIKEELQKFYDKGITEEELKRSKDAMLKSLVFEYEKPFGIVASIARFVHLGYPENYIDVYRRGIAGVRVSDVNLAAKKHLHPDKLKIVVVGKYE